LIPALARDPDADQLEDLRRCLLRGDLSQTIVAVYGRELQQSLDDVKGLSRLGARRDARVAQVLDEIAALEADGRWDRIDDRSAWLARRLPLEADRRRYFELVEAEASRLPSGTPFAEAFLRAARAARTHGGAAK
jgi:hypothetical protein